MVKSSPNHSEEIGELLETTTKGVKVLWPNRSIGIYTFETNDIVFIGENNE
jgi:hypothetical protein